MAVTGKGDFPFRSALLRAPSQLWTVIREDDDNAETVIWRDLLFEAAASRVPYRNPMFQLLAH